MIERRYQSLNIAGRPMDKPVSVHLITTLNEFDGNLLPGGLVQR